MTILVHQRAVLLAKLLADGVHLTAEEVLALLLLGSVFDIVSDSLSHLELRQPFTLKLQGQRQPLDDVEGFEQSQLLVEIEIGRIAGRISQGAGRRNGPHERPDPSVVAAQLENLVHDRAVLSLQLTGEAGRRRLVGPDLVVGGCPAEGRPMQTHQGHGEPATGEPHSFGDLRHDAHLRVGLVLPGHQQHLIVSAHVDGQADRHAGEHHRLVQRNDS